MRTIKSAIVTGATGFIGSWLTLELLKQKTQVVLIVRNKERLIKEVINNPNVCVLEKELADIKKEDFQHSDYDVFFHLAWNGVAPENKNNYHLQISNIEMSLKSIEICNEIGCKLFISFGTVAEYTLCDGVMDLYEKQSPSDMYGASKVATHYFLDVMSKNLNQDFMWVVLPSTFGERRTGNNIITYTIKMILDNKKPQYGKLDQMWDFLYVQDVVRAIVLIAKKGKSGKIYGIGSGNYKKLSEYIEIIKKMINPNIELGIGELEESNTKVLSSCVNIGELVKDTGFKPAVSFEEGIKRTIDYIKTI